MAAPTFGTTDIFTLGADWEVQSVSPGESSTRATARGNDGDTVASTTHNTKESGTVSAIYIGSETDFAAAFADDSCDVGDVMDSKYLLTGWEVDYAPCADGNRPMVTFDFTDGPTSAGATYVTALTLPTYVASTPVVPEAVLTATAGDAEIQSLKVSLKASYSEDLDASGDFLAGAITNGEETIEMQWVGTPSSITSTGYDEVSAPGTNSGETTSNTAYGTASYTFVKGITRS